MFIKTIDLRKIIPEIIVTIGIVISNKSPPHSPSIKTGTPAPITNPGPTSFVISLIQ